MKSPRRQMLQSFLLAGILPLVAFSLIEDRYGTLWGLVVGMVFGVGEILYEWRARGKVDAMTWGGNGLLLVLGGISLLTQEGIFFKLQPAVIEAVMALGLWGSAIAGKPFLVGMTRKQLVMQQIGQTGAGVSIPPRELPPVLVAALGGMTWRLGLFFALHAVLASWAALKWSTGSWAFLKGAGFTGSMILYVVAESLVLRYRIATRNHDGKRNPTGRSR